MTIRKCRVIGSFVSQLVSVVFGNRSNQPHSCHLFRADLILITFHSFLIAHQQHYPPSQMSSSVVPPFPDTATVGAARTMQELNLGGGGLGLAPITELVLSPPRNVVDSAESYTPTRPPFAFVLQREQPGTIQDVVIATHDLCRTLGKVPKMKRRDTCRVYMVCGTQVRGGDCPCPFFIRATVCTSSTVKLTGMDTNHSCATKMGRKRQVKSSVLAVSSPCVEFFVPSKGRAGGNAYQLQTQMRVQHGITLKTVHPLSQWRGAIVTIPFSIVTMGISIVTMECGIVTMEFPLSQYCNFAHDFFFCTYGVHCHKDTPPL